MSSHFPTVLKRNHHSSRYWLLWEALDEDRRPPANRGRPSSWPMRRHGGIPRTQTVWQKPKQTIRHRKAWPCFSSFLLLCFFCVWESCEALVTTGLSFGGLAGAGPILFCGLSSCLESHMRPTTNIIKYRYNRGTFWKNAGHTILSATPTFWNSR